MLEHEATPAFTNNHEIGVFGPKFLGHLDKEWVWISLHVVRVPVTVVLISNDNLTVHKVFCTVSGLSIYVIS